MTSVVAWKRRETGTSIHSPIFTAITVVSKRASEWFIVQHSVEMQTLVRM